MRAAAIIALLVAIVLGVGSMVKFADDSKLRDYAANLNERDYNLLGYFPEEMNKEVEKYDAAKQTDSKALLIAVTFLIASLVMFSKAKPQPIPTAPEVNTMPVEFKPNPNFREDALQAATKKLQDALSTDVSSTIKQGDWRTARSSDAAMIWKSEWESFSAEVNMAAFKDVFNTNWKVVVSLFIVFVIVDFSEWQL